jgi:peptidoglycan/LPS O-acetylase OafA/YrhL
VRAIAVAGVLLYHSEMPWFQGGFLGVDVFFVLSGFLITGLLAREIEREGRLNIGSFYLRRFRRLVPAVLLLLVSTLVLSAFFVPDAAPRVKSDGLAALFYVSNWWLIASGQSYFEFISRPPLLQHLWSLAIEEQFYVVWPVVVWTAMRLAGRRGLAALALVGAAVSTWWMATLSAAHGYPDADPSRIYFGTDTHCMGLLLGAALAAVWQPWTAGALTRRVNGGFVLLGMAASAAVAFAYVQVGERAPLVYSGGFLLLSVAVCGLIVAASHPGSWFGRLLGRQPLRWMGERSYGLYLWHWPIYVVTRPGLDIQLTDGANLLLRLALTCAVAELSYRFIEHPIREGAIGRFAQAWRQASHSGRRPLAWRASVAVLPAAAMLVMAGAALAITPSAKPGGEIAPDVAEAMGIANGGPTKVTIERFAARPPSSMPPAVATNGRRDATAPVALAGTIVINLEGPGRVTQVNDGGLTAVGDSVLLGMRFQLERSIPGVQLDAEVGRQAFMVLQRLRDLKAENLLAPTVLIHIGTNSYVGEKPLRRTLVDLADRQLVILVNAHAPRRWVTENNEMLSRVVRDYPNAVLIDFAEAATLHPEFFVSDDIHLTAAGQRALVDAVKRAGNFRTGPRRVPKATTVVQPEAEAVSTESATGDAVVTEPAVLPDPAAAPDPATAPVIVPEDSNPADTLEPIEPGPPVTLGMVRLSFGQLAAGDTTPAPARHPKPKPLDRYWEAIARCETGGDWKNGGRYAGGLGIFIQTWEGWGGREFAPTPDAAAPHEQIIVANRISTQGWTRSDNTFVRPVGFGGWGCVKKVGAPELLTFEPASVIAQPFSWRQRGELVRDLQAILGLPRDGVYGRQTWETHIRHLEARQLPRTLAPATPSPGAATMLTMNDAGDTTRNASE